MKVQITLKNTDIWPKWTEIYTFSQDRVDRVFHRPRSFPGLKDLEHSEAEMNGQGLRAFITGLPTQ